MKRPCRDRLNPYLFEGTHVSFWLDEDEIPLGVRLQEAIRAGIRNSDFLALFLTPDSVSSGWVEKEIEWAKEQELPVVAILLAQTDVPEAIREFLFIDVIRLGVASARDSLLTGLRRGLEQRNA